MSGQLIFFILDTGAIFSVLMEFWGPTFCFSAVGVGGQPYRPLIPPLSCGVLGIVLYSSLPSDASLSCPFMGKRTFRQNGSLCFLCSCSTPASPAVLLLLLQTTEPDTPFPLPPSQVVPQVRDADMSTDNVQFVILLLCLLLEHWSLLDTL